MSEGLPIAVFEGGERAGHRSVCFHDHALDPAMLTCKGGFFGGVPDGHTLWSAQRLEVDTILQAQGVTGVRRLAMLGMMGACMYDIGASLPHPHVPHRLLRNLVEKALCIVGAPCTGKSTLLGALSAVYAPLEHEHVGYLSQQSASPFLPATMRTAKLVIKPEDGPFSISRTTLASMLSGEEGSNCAAAPQCNVQQSQTHPARAGERMDLGEGGDITVPYWRAMLVVAGVEDTFTGPGVKFHFDRKIENPDPQLLDRIRADMPNLIWVCSWALKVRPLAHAPFASRAFRVDRRRAGSVCAGDAGRDRRRRGHQQGFWAAGLHPQPGRHTVKTAHRSYMS